MNSCQSQSIDEEVRCRLNHQSLLQEYLHSQKEFVSKKKKLQITKKKRDILLGEIRFLRQRHRYLMELHSHNFQSKREFPSPEESSVWDENLGRPFKMVKLKNSLTNNKRSNENHGPKGKNNNHWNLAWND